MMKRLLALTLMAFLAGCGSQNQVYNIADVTKPEAITLKKVKSQGNIHYLTVLGTGHIERTGKTTLILNGKPYKTESLSGDVQFTLAGDWYSDSATLEFKPTAVKSRGLRVRPEITCAKMRRLFPDGPLACNTNSKTCKTTCQQSVARRTRKPLA